ncbi:MAG: ACT domain-containing protein [Parvularculaceae bacterium]
MNISEIKIEFDSVEGAVRRLLGVIEQRGFDVRSMSMGSDMDNARMTLGLAPRDSGRCLDVLSRQIARVEGVRTVARVNAAAPFEREAHHAAHA